MALDHLNNVVFGVGLLHHFGAPDNLESAQCNAEPANAELQHYAQHEDRDVANVAPVPHFVCHDRETVFASSAALSCHRRLKRKDRRYGCKSADANGVYAMLVA